MEPNSFTSEPQYQRPDERNDMVHYIPRPVIQQAASVPSGPMPVGAYHYLDPNMARPLFTKFGRDPWVFNRLDFYGNSLILGAICNAIAFIIYGFYRCKVYRVNDTFLWSIILLFGGIGQITAGFLEYCKGRSFSSTLYLCLGFYCLSHYAYYVIPPHFDINYNTSMYYTYDEGSMCAYYSGWVCIAFALLLASTRTNILYILHCAACFAFFMLRAAGEGCGSLGTKWHAAGILETIAGFLSLLIGLSQIFNNEICFRECFPTCPMCPDNEIDVFPNYKMYPIYGNIPIVNNPPVAPIQPGVPIQTGVPVEQNVPIV